jgi:hypothetical protein
LNSSLAGHSDVGPFAKQYDYNAFTSTKPRVPKFDARKLSIGIESGLSMTMPKYNDVMGENEQKRAKQVFNTYLSPSSLNFLEQKGIKKSTVKQLYMIKPIVYRQENEENLQ